MKAMPPRLGVIEFKMYIKQEINGKTIIIFQRAPKLIANPKVQIGAPVDYDQRMKNRDYNKLKEEFDKVDLKIPEKEIKVQPMEDDPEEIIDQNLNEKDRQILNNPEEEKKNNPFKVATGGEDIESDEEKDLTYEQKLAHEMNSKYTPIQALVANFRDWTIRARIAKKYPRKCWDNARGRGYLLSFELIDSYGSSISCTMFKETVDKYDHMLEEGAVYTFSGGQIKPSNKRYTSL